MKITKKINTYTKTKANVLSCKDIILDKLLLNEINKSKFIYGQDITYAKFQKSKEFTFLKSLEDSFDKPDSKDVDALTLNDDYIISKDSTKVVRVELDITEWLNYNNFVAEEAKEINYYELKIDDKYELISTDNGSLKPFKSNMYMKVNDNWYEINLNKKII
jgi:hypothetical protein